MRGHRRQRVFRLELALGRAAKVRSHHHRRALAERVTDTRQRGADARVVGDGKIVVLRHIEVGADENTLARDVKVCEAFEGHGDTRLETEVERRGVLEPIHIDFKNLKIHRKGAKAQRAQRPARNLSSFA
jgi:hypothetical protein